MKNVFEISTFVSDFTCNLNEPLSRSLKTKLGQVRFNVKPSYSHLCHVPTHFPVFNNFIKLNQNNSINSDRLFFPHKLMNILIKNIHKTRNTR